MPGRQTTTRRHAHDSPSTSAPRTKSSKQKRRAQNALAIAEHSIEEKSGLKRARFGDLLQSSPGKRAREESDEDGNSDEDDGGRTSKKLKGGVRDRYAGQADVEFGSDSEGNEWVVGQVDDADDDSVDSDEAFGESDEERFEGFSFRGSSSEKKQRTRSKTGKAMQGGLLDEEDDDGSGDEELDSGEESDNFKENAVDLATMLDDNLDEESEDEDDSRPKLKSSKKSRISQRHDSNDEMDDEDDDQQEANSDYESSNASSIFSVEDDNEDPSQQNTLLNDLVAGFDTGDQSAAREEKARIRAQEALDPSTAPAGSTADLFSALDPSLSALQASVTKASKRPGKGIPGVVEVPLAQRQQGRLDRAAAFEKSKETLNRWVDTVKHNRRAEHLVFPLHNQDEASAKNANRMQSVTESKPFNDLEATIKNILLESGMAPTSAKTEGPEGDEGLALEGAGEEKLTLAEVKARNAELRRAREMLFREEIKAKRVKKIKSKSYRRVHRKERERNLERQQQLDEEMGVAPEEEDQDRLDRMRAEERMGAKHRESKWAKAIKASGRANWDEDARGGIIDMARREEELKRRIHGQAIGRDADGEGSADDSDYDSDVSDDEANEQIRNELFRLRDEPEMAGKGTKLASMKFMQKAEAARKEQNEAAIAELQRDLDGRESEEESDSAATGRRRFGPASNLNIALPAKKEQRNEFEERDNSDAEDMIPRVANSDNEHDGEPNDAKKRVSTKGTNRSTRHQEQAAGRSQPRNSSLLSQEKPKPSAESDVMDNPWFAMQAPKRNSKKTAAASAADQAVFVDPDNVKPQLPAPAKQLAKESNRSKSRSAGSSKQVRLLSTHDDDTSSSGESDAEEPNSKLAKQRGLIQAAFADDEAVANFEAEKREMAREERSPSPSADVLPGWGAWTGAGLNKKDKKERKQRTERLEKAAKDAFAASKGGRKVDQTRKDANLDGVIISEKKAPKGTKYLATTLPHGFESRAQYERSLRVPVGPEWTTKETHQASTKPRIIMGGGIIKPMEKPLV